MLISSPLIKVRPTEPGCISVVKVTDIVSMASMRSCPSTDLRDLGVDNIVNALESSVAGCSSLKAEDLAWKTPYAMSRSSKGEHFLW